MKNKIRVLSVFGTRPEAVKMAPLVLALKEDIRIDSLVCVSGQHREMLDQVLGAFGIVPDFDLNIMEYSQTLANVTSKTMSGLNNLLEKLKVDIVLVHGDTTTTFGAALGAYYAKTDVGHVEAGLRTYDKYSPFPEEMNRQMCTRIARLHFAPTEKNAQNLTDEGVVNGVFVTGNTVIDALKYTVRENYEFECKELSKLDFDKQRIILMTAHRRENYGEPFENIMSAAGQIARDNPDVLIVYPVHLSPYVKEMANKNLGDVKNIKLISPLGVFDMHNLIKRSYLVLTDSGGLQEEAPSLGKPVLVMRTETERPEAIHAGTARMVGVEHDSIVSGVQKLLDNSAEYEKMAHASNPYGDGNSSKRIVEHIIKTYEKK